MTDVDATAIMVAMARQRLAQQLKALGEPSRLRILRTLPVTDDCPGVYNVSELAGELRIAQPMISHHLRVLRQVGLVRHRKMCRDVYYWVDQSVLKAVMAELAAVVRRKPKAGRAGRRP